MRKSIFILLVMLGCQPKSAVDLALITEEARPIILPANTCGSTIMPDTQVTKQEGTVGYRDDLAMYYINVYLGGIDTSLSGLVCNMPDELKMVGQRVVFDGQYYTDKQLPMPRLGGETIRYLVLQSIKKK